MMAVCSLDQNSRPECLYKAFEHPVFVMVFQWHFIAHGMLHFTAASSFFLGNFRIRSISSQKVFLRAVECGSWVAFGYIGQAQKMLSAIIESLKHKLVARNDCGSNWFTLKMDDFFGSLNFEPHWQLLSYGCPGWRWADWRLLAWWPQQHPSLASFAAWTFWVTGSTQIEPARCPQGTISCWENDGLVFYS